MLNKHKVGFIFRGHPKVKAFFVQFTALHFPELQSEAGKAMAVRVNEALAIVKQVIIQDSKTLL